MYDGSFDCIFIRIHPRAEGSTDVASTRLLAHVVSNQEIMYDETSQLSRFHGRSYSFPRTVEQADRIVQRNVTASSQRSVSNRGTLRPRAVPNSTMRNIRRRLL